MARKSGPKTRRRTKPGKTISPQTDIDDLFIRSGGSFKVVKAGRLFTVKSNPQLDKESFNFSEDSQYPYFTRTVSNNGLLGFVDFLDEEHLIKGNSIAVGMMGMQFFYQSHDFYAGQFTKTIFPKFNGLNEKIALWFIAWFNKHSKRLKGELVRKFESLFNDIEIVIPVKNNSLDIEYIESRIRELEESRIRELEAYLSEAGFDNCNLTDQEQKVLSLFENKSIHWELFKLSNLYDKLELKNKPFDKRKDTISSPNELFSIPLVNAKHGDNGIMFYGRSDVFDSSEMTIDIVQNGAIATGNVYAQPQRTGVLWDAYLIKAINHSDTENSLLFIACAIQKTIKSIFSYENKAIWGRVKHQSIPLPVMPSGEIDFGIIETYITAIKKKAIQSIKEFIAQEHQAYISVV